MSVPIGHLGIPNDESNKLDPIHLVIINDGDGPAKNIGITVEFPENFELFNESDVTPSPFVPHINISKNFGGLYKDEKKNHICRGWIDELGNDLQIKLNPIYPKPPDEDKEYEIKISITKNNYPMAKFNLKIKVNIQHPKIIKTIQKPNS